MPTHNPVPFDFVPFEAQDPDVRKVEDWEGEGELLSGRIDYTLKTLTPLHIVGRQTSNGSGDQLRIAKSEFNRSGGKTVIPGTSIKGMLRAFFEALTNAWASQAIKTYEKKEGKRQYAFSAWGEPAEDAIDKIPAIPKRFHPIVKDDRIDLASFLFGMVAESMKKDKSEGEKPPAFKSRFLFEDIVCDAQLLDSDTIKLPDIPGKAFMGGPKPRKNNWWYFKPYCIRKRTVHRSTSVADFIGGEFWGRKFYYHQKPEQVLRWYDDEKNWPHTTEKKIQGKKQWIKYYYTYPVEIIPADTEASGSIYFEFVPAPLLSLLLFALRPNNAIKHKLGYGKAFGLGSVDFKINKVEAVESTGLSVLANSFPTQPEENECLKYIHTNALLWLTLIQSFDELIKSPDCLFSYPRFGEDNDTAPGDVGCFKQVIYWDKHICAPGNNIPVTQKQAEEIALKLLNNKQTDRPIHFRVYQETTDLWDKLLKRVGKNQD